MIKKYHVFILDTHEDDAPERDAAIQAVLECGCIPVGSFGWFGQESKPWDIIHSLMGGSDYFLVLPGGKYDYEAAPGSKDASFFELAYDFALESKKPIIALIQGMKSPLQTPPQRGTGKSPDVSVRYWSTPADLKDTAASALQAAIREHPGIGWLRYPDDEVSMPLHLTAVRPRTMEDAYGVIQYFLEGNLAVIDLSLTPQAPERRMVDLLTGSAFAAGGSIVRVSTCIYLMIPAGVTFDTDVFPASQAPPKY